MTESLLFPIKSFTSIYLVFLDFFFSCPMKPSSNLENSVSTLLILISLCLHIAIPLIIMFKIYYDIIEKNPIILRNI